MLAVNCLVPFGPRVSAVGETAIAAAAVTINVTKFDWANGVSSARNHFSMEILIIAGAVTRSDVMAAESWVGLMTEASRVLQTPPPLHQSTSV